MSTARLHGLFVTTLAGLAITQAATGTDDPRLSIHGKPYFGGEITIGVVDEDDPGALAALGLGFDPLPLGAPIPTGKGEFYIGTLVSTLPLGALDGSGTLLLDTTLPPTDPPLIGFDIALQAFVDGRLSNPASLSLDEPYWTPTVVKVIENPEPMVGAAFGDQVAVGDLNADGHTDIAVGAWKEDFAGVNRSGRVYVFWGPDHGTYMPLAPTNPKEFGEYGLQVEIADVIGDATVDLIVAEGTGQPVSGDPARIDIHAGGTTFSTTASLSIDSPGTDLTDSLFGRILAVGDLDGDGARDIAVGRSSAEVSALANAGTAIVYWGPTFDQSLTIPNPAPQDGDYFGSRLAIADLTTATGLELVEASGGTDAGGVGNIGSAHVFEFVGRSSQLALSVTHPEPEGFNTRFGNGLLVADLIGDANNDLVIADNRGRVYVFTGPDADTHVTVYKPPTYATGTFTFATSMTATDLNGDGINDLVMDEYLEGELVGCGILVGEGMLMSSIAPHFATYHTVHNPLPACGDQFGFGGVQLMPNNFVVAAPTADTTAVNAGEVFIFEK